METWKEFGKDYTIKKWDEESFNIDDTPTFVQDAYKNKKWAFVSDYVRALALYKEGGIYLDTDVELRKTLDQFLVHRAFSGFEIKGYPFTALWGSIPGHLWPQLVLDFYNNKSFSAVPNTGLVSKILVEHFGADPNYDKLQNLKDGIAIYPSNYFCVDLPVNYACHHFNGSWMYKGKVKSLSYNKSILFKYYQQEAISLQGEKELVKSISWSALLTEIPKRFVRPLMRRLNHWKYKK
jgi:hypothetical protein